MDAKKMLKIHQNKIDDLQTESDFDNEIFDDWDNLEREQDVHVLNTNDFIDESDENDFNIIDDDSVIKTKIKRNQKNNSDDEIIDLDF